MADSVYSETVLFFYSGQNVSKWEVSIQPLAVSLQNVTNDSCYSLCSSLRPIKASFYFVCLSIRTIHITPYTIKQTMTYMTVTVKTEDRLVLTRSPGLYSVAVAVGMLLLLLISV